MKKVIAIDGMAGAGKGTLAKLLAQKLDYQHLDSGALYRAFTLKVINTKTKINEKSISKLLLSTKIEIKTKNKEQNFFLDGKNVTNELRTPKISDMVATISKIQSVREHIQKIQHKFAEKNNIVVEGRDVSTVVFPNAFCKFFVTAPLSLRAKRRQTEYANKGITMSTGEVKNSIKERDFADIHRENSPLKKAKDAISINNKGTVERALNKMLKIVQKKSKKI